MIDTRFRDEPCQAQLILRPNQSWSWRANLYFLYVLMAVSLTIGISFAWRGMWMILPFTVLELSVLVSCLWYCVRRGYRQQVITVQPEKVWVEFGHFANVPRKTLERVYDRFHTRFQVEPARHPWRNKSVYVRCRGEHLQIGAFLNEEELDLLIRRLREVVRYMDNRCVQ